MRMCIYINIDNGYFMDIMLVQYHKPAIWIDWCLSRLMGTWITGWWEQWNMESWQNKSLVLKSQWLGLSNPQHLGLFSIPKPWDFEVPNVGTMGVSKPSTFQTSSIVFFDPQVNNSFGPIFFSMPVTVYLALLQFEVRSFSVMAFLRYSFTSSPTLRVGYLRVFTLFISNFSFTFKWFSCGLYLGSFRGQSGSSYHYMSTKSLPNSQPIVYYSYPFFISINSFE